MSTVNYLVKYTKTPENRIYFRFLKGRQYQTVMQTPIKIPQGYWNKNKQEVKKGDKLKQTTVEAYNAKLRGLSAFLLDRDRIADIEGELVNTPWLKRHVNEFFNTPDTSKEWRYLFEHYIERFITTTELNPNTKKTFVTAQKLFIKYQEYKNKKYQFKELDKSFNTEFNNWGVMVEGYAPSTIGKSIKLYRHIIKRAKTEGVIINTDVDDFKGPKNRRENLDIYLTPSEIEQIRNYTPTTPSLTNVKNLWLVGLYTGLRVSDLMRFNNPKGITPEENEEYTPDELKNILPLIKDGNIEIVAIKTQQLCVIPIHPDIEPLLKVIRPISDQRFNDYIKDIGKALGWETLTWGYMRDKKKNRDILKTYPKYKLLRSHVMRRSYATNRVEHDGDSLKEVASATGHTTTQELENYIKTTKYYHAKKKQQQWKDNDQYPKQKNTPKK